MFRWVGEPDAEDVGLDQLFSTQADAEAWLAATWEDLLDEGVVTVTLCEGDRVVYGPMALAAG